MNVDQFLFWEGFALTTFSVAALVAIFLWCIVSIVKVMIPTAFAFPKVLQSALWLFFILRNTKIDPKKEQALARAFIAHLERVSEPSPEFRRLLVERFHESPIFSKIHPRT